MEQSSFSAHDTIYLRPGAIVEPLVSGWHAWPHLLPSLQHGLNIALRQIPMLKSYLGNPSFHEEASRNPALAGGSYLDYPAKHADDVAQFVRVLEKDANELIELAGDFVELDRRLQDATDSGTLTGMYEMLPASLRGCVELVYDRNSHSSIRVNERLVNMKHSNAHHQSLRIFETPEDQRKFFLTGLHEINTGLILPVDFGSSVADLFACANVSGVIAAEMIERTSEFSLWESLSSYFSPQPRRRRTSQRLTEKLRITYFGHACVLIETPRASLLLDPVIAWSDCPDGRYTYNDLPDHLDMVAISHGHHDHFSPESLLQIRHKTTRVAVPANNRGSVLDPSLKEMLSTLKFGSIDTLEAMDVVKVQDITITSLPFYGEHGDLDIQSKQCFLVDANGMRLLFLVDSCAFDIDAYRNIVGNSRVDVLFIGMECHGAPLTWLYGPLIGRPLTRRQNEGRRLCASNSHLAWSVVQAVNPEHVCVYAMGLEPWVARYAGFHFDEDCVQLREARAFLKRCEEAGIPAQLLRGSRIVDVNQRSPAT